MTAQTRKFMPGLPAIGGAEHRGVFHSSVDSIGIGERRLQMPNAFELPRMRRAIVPLVRARHAVVGELVIYRSPRLAAIVRTLHKLPKPATALRRINAVGVNRRALQVVQFEAREMRTIDGPVLALAVGFQNEGTFLRAHQYSDLAHFMSFPALLKLGSIGVAARTCQRRRTSAKNDSRCASIFSTKPAGAPVFS